jgi:hypothetical protein
VATTGSFHTCNDLERDRKQLSFKQAAPLRSMSFAQSVSGSAQQHRLWLDRLFEPRSRATEKKWSMGLDQIGITLSGVIAIWLTQDKRPTWRRWACIFGMFAQPFWFYAAWKAEQWGIFAMCTLYTYAWARGLWTHWLSSICHPPVLARSPRPSLLARRP